jgi:hypothetical protein
MAPSGRKAEAPRMRKSLRDDGDTDLVLFGRVEHERSVPDIDVRDTDWRLPLLCPGAARKHHSQSE